MRRFATTIFSATQRCNIVVTLFRIVTTLFQHCNDMLRSKSPLRTSPLVPHILSRFPTQAVLPVKFQGRSALSLSISALRLFLV